MIELTMREPSGHNFQMAWRIVMSFGTRVANYYRSIPSKFQLSSCTMGRAIEDASREVVLWIGAREGLNPRRTVAKCPGRITWNLNGSEPTTNRITFPKKSTLRLTRVEKSLIKETHTILTLLWSTSKMELSMFEWMLLPNEKEYRVEIWNGNAPGHEEALRQV